MTPEQRREQAEKEVREKLEDIKRRLNSGGYLWDDGLEAREDVRYLLTLLPNVPSRSKCVLCDKPHLIDYYGDTEGMTAEQIAKYCECKSQAPLDRDMPQPIQRDEDGHSFSIDYDPSSLSIAPAEAQERIAELEVCSHAWRVYGDSDLGGNREEVICERCSVHGERNTDTGDVFYPAT